MNVEDVGVGRYPGPPPNHRSEMWVEAISRLGCLLFLDGWWPRLPQQGQDALEDPRFWGS